MLSFSFGLSSDLMLVVVVAFHVMNATDIIMAAFVEGRDAADEYDSGWRYCQAIHNASQ